MEKDYKKQIKELEGLINDLLLQRKNISGNITRYRNKIKDLERKNKPDPVRTKGMQYAIDYCCELGGISEENLLGSIRETDKVYYRKLLTYILRNYFGYKYEHIAYIIGKRDHASVLYQYNKAKEIIKEDPSFLENYEIFLERIKNV